MQRVVAHMPVALVLLVALFQPLARAQASLGDFSSPPTAAPEDRLANIAVMPPPLHYSESSPPAGAPVAPAEQGSPAMSSAPTVAPVLPVDGSSPSVGGAPTTMPPVEDGSSAVGAAPTGAPVPLGVEVPSAIGAAPVGAPLPPVEVGTPVIGAAPTGAPMPAGNEGALPIGTTPAVAQVPGIQDGAPAPSAAEGAAPAVVEEIAGAPAPLPTLNGVLTRKPNNRCRSKKVLTISWRLYMSYQPQGANFTVPCGTTLKFDWEGEMHGVALVPSLACPELESDFQIIPGGEVSQINTVATYKTIKPGMLYFACQLYGHCQTGQIIQVRVRPSR